MSEIVKEIPHTANYYRILARDNFSGFMPDDCCICGREMNRIGRRGHWIIMTEGGTHMAKLDTVNMNNPGFMGEYGIGSDCARKFKKELEGYLLHYT